MAYTYHNVKNLTWGTLQSAVSATDTTLQLGFGEASKFPSAPFYVVVDDEVMECTAVDTTNNQLTVVRGQDGTTASPHDANRPVEILVVAGNVSELQTNKVDLGGTPSAGQVAFFADSKSVGGDNNLYWDGTNKRLGIGTSTPSEKLEVSGNILVPETGTANSLVQYPSYDLKLTGSAWDSTNLTAVKKTFTIRTNGAVNTSRMEVYNNAGTPVLTMEEDGRVAAKSLLANRNIYRITLYDNGTVTGTTDTIDWNNGDVQKITLANNVTLSFSNADTNRVLMLEIVQDLTGGRTITWPSTVKWAGGTAPTLSTGANAIDIIAFWSDGANQFGSVYGQGFA